MSANWKVSAQDAAKALQQWYGFNNPAGLYTWDASDNQVASALNTSSAAVSAIKTVGLLDTVRDTVRWWNSANAITALIDYMLVTNDRSYENVIENTFKNGPSAWHLKPNLNPGDITQALANYGLDSAEQAGTLGLAGENPVKGFIDAIAVYNTNFIDEYYDDDGWWALAWIKAYDLIGDAKYLRQAQIIFQEMTNGWSDTDYNGGIYWQRNNHEDSHGKKPYKNAIANELFLAVGAALYVRVKDESYLNWANQEWNWFYKSGIINGVAHLITDALGTFDGSTNFWTYNQGVVLGGLCDLFVGTGQPQLLDVAEQIADALISQRMGPNVSGVDEQRILTEFDDGDPNASVDHKQFKGIFVRNLGYLYRHRRLARYRAFILNNANSALAHNMNSSNFGGRWSGPFDAADFVRQTAALDLLNSATSIPPEANYNSFRELLIASTVTFPASAREFLNGSNSLHAAMMVP